MRTPKPTGSATVPSAVQRAFEIEDLINEKVHLRTLDDGDIADGEEVPGAGDSDVEVLDGPPMKKKAPPASGGPVLQGIREQVPSTGAPNAAARGATRRAQASDFMSAVSASLNPALREARDDTRFARRLAQDDLHRLTQENRDLRTRNESLSDRLHQQSLQLQQQLTEASRLQSRLDMVEMMQSFMGSGRSHRSRQRDDWLEGDTPASFSASPRFPRSDRTASPRFLRSDRAASPRYPHSDRAASPHRARFDLAASPLRSRADHSRAPSTLAFHSPVAMHPSPSCRSPSPSYPSFELHAEHRHWGPAATEGPYASTTAVPSTALSPSRPTTPDARDTVSHMPVLPSLGQFSFPSGHSSALDTLATAASSSQAGPSVTVTATFTLSRRHREQQDDWSD